MKHFENNHGSEKVVPCFLIMFGGVVFGPVVSVVGLPRPPVNAKLLKALTIAEPMKTHVRGFGLFSSDFPLMTASAMALLQVERDLILAV